MTQIANPYKVIVIVDQEFGERLAALAPSVPVWIVDTPINKPVAQRLWKERPHDSHLIGITTFGDGSVSATAPEDLLMSMLDTIELHHDRYSADPPYTIIEVFGTCLNAKIKVALSEHGFNDFQSNVTGFRATRLLPTD